MAYGFVSIVHLVALVLCIIELGIMAYGTYRHRLHTCFPIHNRCSLTPLLPPQL